MRERSSIQFRIASINKFFVASVMLSIQMIIFFVSAGHMTDYRPWLYFSTALIHYFVSVVVQHKLNPQLLVQRLKRKRKGSKLWDEILMRVCNLMVIFSNPAVAGLDGRFHWSNLDVHFTVAGL